MKKLLLLLIVLAIGFALGVYYAKQPKTEKIETKVQAGVSQVSDAVKAGVQKAGAVASDVKDDLAAGAQKVVAATTNVAAQVKTGVTNAVGEIKQKLN